MQNENNTKHLYEYKVWYWVSKWLLFNANSAMSQLYLGENKIIFDEIIKKLALY
jgi:hypothetical protein